MIIPLVKHCLVKIFAEKSFSFLFLPSNLHNLQMFNEVTSSSKETLSFSLLKFAKFSNDVSCRSELISLNLQTFLSRFFLSFKSYNIFSLFA